MTDKRENAAEIFATDGARPRVTRSPTRKIESVVTRSQTTKTGKTAEDKSDTGCPSKSDMMYEILCELKRNMEASSVVMYEFHKKLEKSFEQNIEISRRINALEARKKEAWRDECRSDAGLAEGKSTEGDNVSASHTVRVGENATLNARLPKGGWLKNPFEEIRFFGRTDKQNPMKFLRRFERTAEYEGVGENDQLQFFGRCLRGAASTWFDVSEPENMQEAREMFVKHFWGEEHQARFREDVYTGKYNAASGESMSEYALNLIKQTKMLDPPMTDHEVIRCVKRHYGPGISREVRPTTVKNLEEFVTLLDEIELERERNKKFDARKNDTATKAKSNAENKRDVPSKKPWSKDTNVKAFNNKFTRNNVSSAKSKTDDDESVYAKGDKNTADNVKSAINKENKNIDPATRVEKPVTNKNFSTRRNVAVVQANEVVTDSEEEDSAKNIPKVAALRRKTKGIKPNKITRDAANAEKFAKIKYKTTAKKEIIPETAGCSKIRTDKENSKVSKSGKLKATDTSPKIIKIANQNPNTDKNTDAKSKKDKDKDKNSKIETENTKNQVSKSTKLKTIDSSSKLIKIADENPKTGTNAIKTKLIIRK